MTLQLFILCQDISPLFSFVFFSIVVIQHKWDDYAIATKHPPIYIPPPKYIHHFSFGYYESLSDSLWLRWVQDVDICGANKVSRQSVLPQKQIPRHIAGQLNQLNDKILVPLRNKICDRGWSFRLLDAITRLTPKFRMPYAVGASTLSILIDDHLGAKIIYERAMKYFPDDWKILYRAAYHYLYELQELEKAAELLDRAGDAGAPFWVKSLASRLATRAGKIDLGIRTLEEYFRGLNDSEPAYREEIQARLQILYEIKGLSPGEIQKRLEKIPK